MEDLEENEKQLQMLQLNREKLFIAKIESKSQEIIKLKKNIEAFEQQKYDQLNILQTKDQEISELSEKILQLRKIFQQKDSDNEDNQKIYQQREETYKQEIIKQKDKSEKLYEKIEELKNENKYYKNNQQQNHEKITLKLEESLDKLQQENLKLASKLKAQEDYSKENKHKVQLQKIIDELQQDNSLYIQRIKEQQTELDRQNNTLNIQQQNKQIEIIDLNKKLSDIKNTLEITKHQLESEKQSYLIFEQNYKNQFKQQQEKVNDLQTKIQQKKKKYKLSLNIQQSNHNQDIDAISQEIQIKAKKAEIIIKDLEMENQKLLVNENFLKIKVKEYFSYIDQKIEQSVKKAKQLKFSNKKSLEQDVINLKNELDLISHQNSQALTDKNSMEKKYEIIQAEYYKANKNVQQLEKENKALIEEVIKYKQMRKSQVNQDKQNNLDFSDDYMMDDAPESVVNFFQKNPSKFQKNSPIQSNKQSQMNLASKLKQLETDNNNYKIVIDSMTQEMDSVSEKFQKIQREVTYKNDEIQMLRQKINDIQNDNLSLREQLIYMKSSKALDKNLAISEVVKDQPDSQNEQAMKNLNDQLEKKTLEFLQLQEQQNQLKQKVKMYKEEIQKMKDEKTKLINISTDLKQQIRVQVTEIQEKKDIEIQEKQKQIDKLSHDINQFQILDKLKNSNIKSLSQALQSNQQVQGDFELDDGNEELDITAVKENIDNFNQEITQIKQEVKKEVVVAPKAMQLSPKPTKESKQIQLAKNKALVSQQIALEKMKLQKPKQAPNYNKLKEKESFM